MGFFVLVAVALAGCGGGATDGGDAATEDGGDAVSEGGGDAVSQGEQLFTANCAPCHGLGATGTEQGPPLVHEYYEPSHHSDDAFRSAVANGVQPHHWEFGPMPPVPGVQGEEVEAIIAYVRGLQREAGIN